MADPETRTCSVCERDLPVFQTEACADCMPYVLEFWKALEQVAGKDVDWSDIPC